MRERLYEPFFFKPRDPKQSQWVRLPPRGLETFYSPPISYFCSTFTEYFNIFINFNWYIL